MNYGSIFHKKQVNDEVFESPLDSQAAGAERNERSAIKTVKEYTLCR